MGLFGTEKVTKKLAEEVVGMVETYYRHRGLDHKQYELQGSEGCGWWLTEGSAKIYIFVQDSPSGAIVRITSPLVYLPEKNLEVFYRHLLDLNTNLTNCALATHENIVLCVAQRPTMGMSQPELEELVWNVAYVADLLDNKLADQFGLQLYAHQQAATNTKAR
ncbi:MAG TPA: YbjN domain-containing protein [Oculatellaceae cyanobacterium]